MICIWPSRCHCYPVVSCFIKIQNGLLCGACQLTQIVLEKMPLNGCRSAMECLWYTAVKCAIEERERDWNDYLDMCVYVFKITHSFSRSQLRYRDQEYRLIGFCWCSFGSERLYISSFFSPSELKMKSALLVGLWYIGTTTFSKMGDRPSLSPPLPHSGEVLAWLSVCSKMQIICIWSSCCHCHPIVSRFINYPDWFNLPGAGLRLS